MSSKMSENTKQTKTEDLPPSTQSYRCDDSIKYYWNKDDSTLYCWEDGDYEDIEDDEAGTEIEPRSLGDLPEEERNTAPSNSNNNIWTRVAKKIDSTMLAVLIFLALGYLTFIAASIYLYGIEYDVRSIVVVNAYTVLVVPSVLFYNQVISTRIATKIEPNMSAVLVFLLVGYLTFIADRMYFYGIEYDVWSIVVACASSVLVVPAVLFYYQMIWTRVATKIDSYMLAVLVFLFVGYLIFIAVRIYLYAIEYDVRGIVVASAYSMLVVPAVLFYYQVFKPLRE